MKKAIPGKVEVTVSIDQARVIAEALDVYARLSIGQVNMISEMVAYQKIPVYAENGKPSVMVTAEVCDAVRDKMEQVNRLLGYSGLGNMGIGSDHVPMSGRRAYEVSRVMEKALAEHRDPNPSFRGVDYDGLRVRYTQDTLPVVAISQCRTHTPIFGVSPKGKSIMLAANFAADKHRNQRRRDRAASPYINHPLALAYVLSNEVSGVDDEDVIVAALLHDTVEDTNTTPDEIIAYFGVEVANMVMEVTDNKSLPKTVRKQLQIDHAPSLSKGAKLVKLADKICNLRDMAISPPHDWAPERIAEYFEWAKAVVDAGLRGIHDELEAFFDEAYSKKPGLPISEKVQPSGVTDQIDLTKIDLTMCKKCGGAMRQGRAIGQTCSGMPDFVGDTGVVTMSPGGPGRLIYCMKCERCGWSTT